jgi:Chalcone isomerase-like
MDTRLNINRRAACGAIAALATTALHAQPATPAAPSEVLAELPGARLQGSGRLRVLGFSVYDIRLWVAAPVPAAEVARVPLALEIEYTRALVGLKIAERSLEEMRRQAAIPTDAGERWLAQMAAIFPDVQPGDRLTGKQRPGEATRFFFNGKLRGEVRDADFTRLFFGIWLSPRTSEPALRDALLGPTRAGS